MYIFTYVKSEVADHNGGKREKKNIQGGKGGGQFRIASIHRCPLRVFLKATRDWHVLMTVGRAYSTF